VIDKLHDTDSVADSCYVEVGETESIEDCELSVPCGQKTCCDVKRKRVRRLCCEVLLKTRHPDYKLVPAIIGKGGCNVRWIHEQPGAKIRVRGRGSGHFEVDGNKEANVPLMIAITANGVAEAMYVLAVQLVLQRLNKVNVLFQKFCRMRNIGKELADVPFFHVRSHVTCFEGIVRNRDSGGSYIHVVRGRSSSF
jgi:hypothetical protein